MRWLIISDSHGRCDLVEAVSSKHKFCDGTVFLGDGIRDINCLDITEGGRAFVCVRGNCDFSIYPFTSVDDEVLFNIDGYSIFACHGHTLGVKSGFMRGAVLASKMGADVFLFGHTHEPLEKYIPEGYEYEGYVFKKPLYAFNPGSLGRSYDGTHSFGLLQIKNGQLLLSHGKI